MSDAPYAVPHDAPPPRRVMPRPVLTTVLIAINVLVFVAMILRGVSASSPLSSDLLRWGANWGPLSLGSEPWRMLTSNYVHGGILHIALNMWCLWNLGMLAEPIFGRLAYFVTYTLCGLAGSIASLFFHPQVVGVGASGAVFGLAGALIAALYLGKLPIDRRALQPTLKSLVSFAGYNLILGFLGNAAGVGIDNAAHIGGLFMGLVLGALLGQILVEPPHARRRAESMMFALAALLLFAAGLVLQKTRGYVVLLERASDAISHHRLGDATKDLEQLIAREPKNSMALVMLGNVYLQQKDFARAEAILKQAQANDPKNLGVQYNLGLLYASTNRFEEARALFERLTRERPDDDDAWMLLGAALDGLNRESEAVTAYKKAVSLNPKNAEAWRELGLAHLNLGETDAAIDALKKSLDLDKTNPAAWRSLGLAYTAAHRPEDAARAFEQSDHLREISPKPDNAPLTSDH